MEDTLRGAAEKRQRSNCRVLILVLMEDTLRAARNNYKTSKAVLILVLMEDTLRDHYQTLRAQR